MSDDTLLPSPAPAPAAGSGRWPRLAIGLAVLVLLLAGAWWYGRSSTAPDRATSDATRLRMMLLESRAQVLDAQLSLYSTNFGNAAQHLEYAKPPLVSASVELRRLDLEDLATKADGALERITAARDLAAKLSLDANSRAGEASRLLGEVLAGLPR